MSAWKYEVRRVTLPGHDNIASSLQEAITAQTEDGLELISCFPEPHHEGSLLHEEPKVEPGEDPYDAIWQTPAGPIFLLVFKRHPIA